MRSAATNEATATSVAAPVRRRFHGPVNGPSREDPPLRSSGCQLAVSAQKIGKVLSGVLCSKATSRPDAAYPRGAFGAILVPYFSRIRWISVRSVSVGNSVDEGENSSSADVRSTAAHVSSEECSVTNLAPADRASSVASTILRLG